MEQPDRAAIPPFAPTCEHALQMAEQQSSILRHLLFWFQDQPYYRAKWHGWVSRLAPFGNSFPDEITRLLSDVEQARQRFPYGYSPMQDTEACTLRGRLSLLKCELEVLRSLREGYQHSMPI